MKVVLINQCYDCYSEIGLGLGLLYLTSFLEKNNHEVSIVSFYNNKYEELFNQIEKINPKIIGLNILTEKAILTYKLIKILKKHFNKIKIILGGEHISAVPKEALINGCDYVITGEIEEEFLRLISNLQKELLHSETISKKIKKRSTTNKKLITNINTMPFPAAYKDIKRKTSFIIGSRGCPYTCYFCSKNVFGQSIRFRSPRNVFEEIKMHYYKFGIKDFRFYDDCFTLNRNQVIKICELIIKHKLEITWWCNTRIDLIDEETILMIKKAGCRMINFGIESGSKKTLETINKRINLDQVIPKLKLIKKYQLQSSVNFIFGFPWEKKQDIKETWSFIKQISPYVEFIGATIFLPRPGTKIYKQLRKEVGYWWNKKIVFQTLKDVIVFDTSRLRYNLFPLDEKVLFEMKKIFKYIQKFNMRKLNLLSRINIYLWSYLSSFSFKMNPLFEKNYIQKAYRLYNSMIKRIKTTFL